MKRITTFTDDFVNAVPETHDILVHANLVVSDSVSQITLHGSRGLGGRARPESDIDLVLIINASQLAQEKDVDRFLRTIFFITLDNWKGSVPLDLAVVFDKKCCGLKCFLVREFDPSLCITMGDCLGFFKVQKGFNGFVSGPAVDCSKMYPFITIWKSKY